MSDNAATTFQNSGNLQFYGFDFQFDWKPNSKINFNSILSTIDNRNLYNYPNLQLSGKAQYRDTFFENYLNTLIQIEGKYIGERTSAFSAAYQYTNSYTNLPPAFILNATAIFGFGKLDLLLMFENILNEPYQIIYGYPMRERTFRYGVRWEFWD